MDLDEKGTHKGHMDEMELKDLQMALGIVCWMHLWIYVHDICRATAHTDVDLHPQQNPNGMFGPMS